MSRLLLDTHALLWFVFDSPQLSAAARDAIESPDSTIVVSMASVWEASIKARIGKLTLLPDVVSFFEDEAIENNFSFLQIELPHLRPLASLPFHHRDPFDRLLIAQSVAEGMPLVSADASLDPYADSGFVRFW